MSQETNQFPYDEVISKYFQGGMIAVDENQKWDYVVNSYFLQGKMVHQEQLLSEELSAEIEAVDGLQESEIGKPFADKSDTGDDLSRTGPEGLLPQENYDQINYETDAPAQVAAATGIELEDNPKQIYDIDGTPPELQEALELQEPGEKDDTTGINLIKAGEEGIKDEIPISDIWKEENDGMVETKQFSFIGDQTFDEAIYQSGQDQEQFNQPSSWIGTVTWNPSTLDATVVMNGKKYNHANVQGKDYDSFEGAPSKGAHWNRFWKDQFNSSNYSEALLHSQKHEDEFDWIDKGAIEEMKKYSKNHGNGKFILAVVSGQTETDHRPEGRDVHRRRWTREELIQNIRTGKGKMTDINHLWSKIDPESGGIYDANWNFKTDRGEMILWETDQAILDAIKNDIITAVSINTGAPRHIHTNCDDGECFIQPHGTILGEHNGIGLAFVVTDPGGFLYNGEKIPAFPPGMKFTKLYLVD